MPNNQEYGHKGHTFHWLCPKKLNIQKIIHSKYICVSVAIKG